MSDNSVWCIVQDNAGIIWVGTSKGLCKYDRRIEHFMHYEHNPDNAQTLSNNFLYSLALESDTSIWIGTRTGIDLFNINTGKVEHLFADRKPNDVLRTISPRGLLKDKEDNLWICTWGNGLYKLNLKTKKVEHFEKKVGDTTALSTDFLRCVYIDKSNQMWLGSLDGLTQFDRKTGKCRNFLPKKDDSTAISGRNVFDIYEDSQKNFWVATLYTGLNKLDRKTGKFTRFVNKKGDLHSLSSNVCICITEVSDGTLWVGTRSGLNKFNYKTNTFEVFDFNNGLPNDAILGIIEDKQGYLWLCTNYGVSRYDSKNKKFKNYFQKDGLQNNEFNSNVYLKMNNGNIVIGGVNGFNIFDPSGLQDDPFIPQIVLTDFKILNIPVKIGEEINGDIVLTKSIAETEQISLSYKNNMFSIDFSALDYAAPKANKYAYKLEGFDKDWIYTSADRRFATYTNLDGGNYTFKVKCSNSNERWNENYRTLQITILPPFWKTWWFITILVMTVLAVIILFFTDRIRRINKQKEFLEKEVKERTAEIFQQNEEIKVQNEQLQLLNATKDKFFSIIAHDLRNPFGVILGMSEILAQEIDSYNKDEAKELSEMIYTAAKNGHNLLENLLQWAMSQTGKMVYRPEMLQFVDIVNQVLAETENAAYLKNIHISTALEPDIKIWADINLTNTVLRNLLTNAIKFTSKGGEINISANKKDKWIYVAVKDSGVGIDSDKVTKLFSISSKESTRGTENEKGTGLGLNLCKEFIEKQGGSIKVESRKGQGSIFTFSLPCESVVKN